MTIGEWDKDKRKADRHVTDGWEDVTMMILKHFIKREQYVEILVWGAHWKAGNLSDSKCIHTSKTFQSMCDKMKKNLLKQILMSVNILEYKSNVLCCFFMILTSLALVFLGIMHKNLVKHATIPDVISVL